ncbi:MAG: hypothetical protein KAH18_07205 [Psychromonas sp.]|nr:hypothetical protein [Psychromonas sp.]
MLLDFSGIPVIQVMRTFSILFYFHVLFSIVIAIIAVFILQLRYKIKFTIAFMVIALFNFIFIGIGYIFSVLLVAALYFIKYKKSLKNVKFIGATHLEEEYPKVNRFCGEGGLTSYVNNNAISHKLRIQALLAISRRKSRESITFLQQSMISQDDEIRLFSFSILDDFEKDINTQIFKDLTEFNDVRQSDTQKAATAKSLAFLYWDMIYFDLRSDKLEEFSVDQSYFYAQKSLELTNKTGESPMLLHTLFSLLGKIFYYKGEFEPAQQHFTIAIEKGSNPDFIIPYLAEIHYIQGNYEAVSTLFANAKGLLINEKMYPIIKQWIK